MSDAADFDKTVKLIALEPHEYPPRNGQVVRGGPIMQGSLRKALRVLFEQLKPEQRGGAVIMFYDGSDDLTDLAVMQKLYEQLPDLPGA